jgi:hypothetical protein
MAVRPFRRGGDVLLVASDTEGSFMMERLLDITDAVVDHVQNLGRRATSEEHKTQVRAH